MSLSLHTLLMLSELLDAQPLPPTHPRLVELAQQVTNARAELAEAIEAAQTITVPSD